MPCWLLDSPNAAEVRARWVSRAQNISEKLNESRYLGLLADVAERLGARLAV